MKQNRKKTLLLFTLFSFFIGNGIGLSFAEIAKDSAQFSLFYSNNQHGEYLPCG